MNIEEFKSLVAECCSVMNDRPLVKDLSPDPRDRTPVSPNKLLFGRQISALPYGEDHLEDFNDPSYIPEGKELGRVWKSLAKKLDIFRRQFADDWLMELRQRHINDHVQDPLKAPDVEEGDLLLIRKENVKRSLWDMATVERVLPSQDGKVRALELRTHHGLVTRPLGKVFPLLKAHELSNNGPQPGIGAADQSVNEHKPDSDQSTNEAPKAPSSPRPSRAAKEAGRRKVRQWTQELQEE